MPWLKIMCVLSLYVVSWPAVAEPAARELTPLAMGELYVPAHLSPRDGEVGLIVHFHGGRRVTPEAIDTLRLNAATLMVNRNGLSSVYREPFENQPNRFAELIDDAQAALRQREGFAEVTVGPVWIVSFSAGYGAVREILKVETNLDRLSGVLLTDSMYGSYAPGSETTGESEPARGSDAPGNLPARAVEPAHVEPYVAFAQRAMDGHAAFVVTHTYLEPGSYAGTHEVAAALVARLGLRSERVAQADADTHAERFAVGDLRLRDRTIAGQLAVLGYDGDTGQDHGQHVARTAVWLPMLGIETAPE